MSVISKLAFVINVLVLVLSDFLFVINVLVFVIVNYVFVINVCVVVIKVDVYAGLWAGFVMDEFVSVMSDGVFVIVYLPS